MAPKIKKTKKLPQLISAEKENILPRSKLKEKKVVQEPITFSLTNSKLEEKESLLLSLKPKINEKTFGFWYKKLQDLEESLKVNKECELYEFNESDGPQICARKKSKKKKDRLQKKREPVLYEHNKPRGNFKKVLDPKRRNNEFHRHSLCREQIILSKEKRKLSAKGEKFTFSTEMPHLGITSTPAINKFNLVGASNFLFLSPIIVEEETKSCKSINKSLLFKQKVIGSDTFDVNFNQETPKVETRLKQINCRRVLRSGKMLNI